jgi:hypothetical protein
MPLEDSCEQFRDKLVSVLPVIGFGWCLIKPCLAPEEAGDPIEPPSAFCARLVEFHYLLGKIKAGIGKVQEQGHPLDKQWLAFSIRDRGDDMYDFTKKPGKYNLRIGAEKPTIKIDPEKLPMPEWMQFENIPCLSGLGYIAESASLITERTAK